MCEAINQFQISRANLKKMPYFASSSLQTMPLGKAETVSYFVFPYFAPPPAPFPSSFVGAGVHFPFAAAKTEERERERATTRWLVGSTNTTGCCRLLIRALGIGLFFSKYFTTMEMLCFP